MTALICDIHSIPVAVKLRLGEIVLQLLEMPTLSDKAFRFALAIARHLNAAGEARPSVPRLMQITGTRDKRTARKVIDGLIRDGLLSKDGGIGRANTYRLAGKIGSIIDAYNSKAGAQPGALDAPGVGRPGARNAPTSPGASDAPGAMEVGALDAPGVDQPGTSDAPGTRCIECTPKDSNSLARPSLALHHPKVVSIENHTSLVQQDAGTPPPSPSHQCADHFFGLEELNGRAARYVDFLAGQSDGINIALREQASAMLLAAAREQGADVVHATMTQMMEAHASGRLKRPSTAFPKFLIRVAADLAADKAKQAAQAKPDQPRRTYGILRPVANHRSRLWGKHH